MHTYPPQCPWYMYIKQVQIYGWHYSVLLCGSSRNANSTPCTPVRKVAQSRWLTFTGCLARTRGNESLLPGRVEEVGAIVGAPVIVSTSGQLRVLLLARLQLPVLLLLLHVRHLLQLQDDYQRVVVDEIPVPELLRPVLQWTDRHQDLPVCVDLFSLQHDICLYAEDGLSSQPRTHALLQRVHINNVAIISNKLAFMGR